MNDNRQAAAGHVPDTTPLWVTTSAAEAFPPLDRDLVVDAVVIGGGLTGVTAAYLLKDAGLTVALVERDRCGSGDTGHTTGHLTAVTDRSLPDLVGSFGQDTARSVWAAGYAALAEVERIVRHEQIDCGFVWTPGFLTERLDEPAAGDRDHLHAVAEEAQRCGFDAEFVEAMPVAGRAAVRFDGQARFHPLQYLQRLARTLPGGGSHVFEQSRADEVSGDPLAVKVGSCTIETTFVVVATHLPIAGRTPLARAALLQADLYPYSTYAIGALIERGAWPDALVWDLHAPYHYARTVPATDHDYVIFGGADHKTGQAGDTSLAYQRLERTLRSLLPGAEVTHRWSGQVIETRDGLPYIGASAPGQFVITGFGGNGLTLGTLGAMMARDAATGRDNPWQPVFDIGRTRLTEGLWHYLKENTDYPYYLIRDRFAGAEAQSLSELGLGDGRILDLRGTRVAAYRDDRGRVSLLSPVCPHLGCHVAWNAAEATWDCPCHGSRFGPTGDLIAGPAERGLSTLEDD